jgi:ABC-type glycerol-3-phosphate transport system substrate-binding protein
MTQRSTRVRLFSLGAVAVLGLAACGGSDSASEDTVAD